MSDIAERVRKHVVAHLDVDESKVTEGAKSSRTWRPTVCPTSRREQNDGARPK